MPTPSPRAGGLPLMLLIVGGVLIGAAFGQATFGFLAGTALGSAVAVAIWLGDRRRD